jgi:hypothetical protein
MDIATIKQRQQAAWAAGDYAAVGTRLLLTAELLRVCRPGGRIGMVNWVPDGYVGELFRTIGRYLPPPPGFDRQCSLVLRQDYLGGRHPQARDAVVALDRS